MTFYNIRTNITNNKAIQTKNQIKTTEKEKNAFAYMYKMTDKNLLK